MSHEWIEATEERNAYLESINQPKVMEGRVFYFCSKCFMKKSDDPSGRTSTFYAKSLWYGDWDVEFEIEDFECSRMKMRKALE